MTALPTYDPTNVGNKPGDGPLRAGGQSRSELPTQPREGRDLPSTLSKAANRMAGALQIVRDLWAGNARLQEEGMKYLPKAPGEEPENYNNRLARAVFTNFFRNTIEGLVGYIFRSDPKLGDDVPSAIVAQWENIDNAGTHGDVFTRDLTADAMDAGHAAIFVEHPATQGGQSHGQEERGEIRPYWIHLKKEQLLSWRTTIEDGRLVLTQLVVLECTMVPDGDFGEREQKRYRVLSREAGTPPLISYRLLEVSDNKAVIEVESGQYPTQTEIPVSEVATSGRRGLFESDPPFLDLAYLNLAHYRQWSDYDTSIHKTCVPIYTETGVDMPPEGTAAAKLVLGPNTARRFTNPEAKTYYTSHDGAALSAVKASLDDLKTDMAMLGLAALQSSKRAAETATAKELDKGASDSALAVTARGVQDALERALGFHAKYLKLESGGSIEINRDYGERGMDAAKMVAWGTLAEKLGIPPRFVLERLMEAGEIPEGTDLDALEGEMLAAMAQKQAQADEIAAAMADRPPQPGQPAPAAQQAA